ncbi:TPA: hypothetical protein RQO57_004478 [Aeromonas dhakensis]|uniref:hypothetical protein n=1 Tax=Aeromonas dhakensis TaxID=196024 RepID=UPI00288F7FBD|nr:hypothetical protein [Aeromonas dhakensis]
MTTINDMVAKATAQRDRSFATAAIMTVNQTYMAAVSDLGLTPNSEAISEAVVKLTELAAEPVHGKRQWMLDHAWAILGSLLNVNFNTEEFPLVFARFEADFADNLRAAERY